MKKYLILLAFFLPFVVSAANTPQVTNVTNSSRIYRTSFYLYSGYNYTFRTYSNADTVVHILNSSNSQVAYNDDCGAYCDGSQGALNSTVNFTPATSGYYYGVLRNYQSGVIGATATIKAYLNGSLIQTQTDRPVGGYKISIDSWSSFQNDFLGFERHFYNPYFYYFNSSKEATGGAEGDDTVMYLMSNYTNITDYDDDSGAKWSAKIVKLAGSSCNSGCYVLGGAYPSTDFSEGNARMIMDYYITYCSLDVNLNCIAGTLRPYSVQDTDLDGISNSLESIMGTSSWSRDTDVDGLNDYLEAYGLGDILLPWEGSSPVEQDIFAEVDYFGKIIDGNMFYFYKNFEADIETRLRNSFNLHGNIRFHVDVDDYLGEMADNKTLKYSECGTGTNVSTFYLEDERANHFTSARTGIYTWVVATNKLEPPDDKFGGKSCGSLGDPAFIISAGFHTGGGSLKRYTGTTIHEYGHIFGLGHNGNDNDDSLGNKNSTLFRSVMNYSYQNAGVPVNVAGDSAWRYSTDSSTTRAGLVWQDTIPDNVSPNYHTIAYAPFSCANSATSPKKYCVDHRTNPYCDCTYEEWTHLDLTGGGIMGLGEGGEETEMEDLEERVESPIFARNGRIIALNLEELISSGEKFTKVTKESEKKEYLEELKKKNQEFWTVEKKKARLENYLKMLEEKGMQEGEDYKIINGEVFFK